jgi:hypothetical protein
MASSHFGKKQTTLLVAVVFYKHSADGELILVKNYYDFVSEYLGHNNVFYNKCMNVLLDELKTKIPFEFTKMYNVTDGGSHFASRYAYWDLGKTSRTHSELLKRISFILFMPPTELKIHQITCPPQHGKGECDGHGAVIKKKARLYLLVGICYYFYYKYFH